MKEFSSQIDIAAKVKALALPDKEKSLKKAEGASVRQQLMNTFEQVGGEEEFARFVKKDERNKRDFYQMWSKLAPKEDGVSGTHIQINVINYGESKDNDSIQLPSAQVPDTSF